LAARPGRRRIPPDGPDGLRAGRPHPLEPQRRDAGGTALPGRAGLLRPVPPGGVPRAARLAPSVRPVPRADVLMPARGDIHSILVIGSGPIVIGQVCAFDNSGAPGRKDLRRVGYRVVLVNSNPATIMADPEFADAAYVGPLT